MNLQNIIDSLELNILTKPSDFSIIIPSNGYSSDLLSCVMAGAPPHSIWVTLQAHINIVAVASLLEISAVVITENAMPDKATIAKANSENIVLLSSPFPTYTIIGKLWECGLR